MRKLTILLAIPIILVGCATPFPNKIRAGSTFKELERGCNPILYGSSTHLVYADKDSEKYGCYTRYYHANDKVVKIEVPSRVNKYDVNLKVEQK